MNSGALLGDCIEVKLCEVLRGVRAVVSYGVLIKVPRLDGTYSTQVKEVCGRKSRRRWVPSPGSLTCALANDGGSGGHRELSKEFTGRKSACEKLRSAKAKKGVRMYLWSSRKV